MFELKAPLSPAIWIDGVESNAQHPDTFLIPDAIERRGAKIGDFVKIGVESIKNGHEKFWVEIVACVDNGNYIGRIDNDLADCWGIAYNDHVQFEPKHILATQ